MGPSIAVDKVELTFIVDNTLEWFTKLPPGFTHELRYHLADEKNRRDVDFTGLPFVDLDNYCCAAHGLAVLVTTTKGDDSHTVLFDTGPEAKSISRNMASMRTSLSSIETIVLSHWHRDHSGGILQVLQEAQRTDIVVDLQPDRPIARGMAPPPFDKVIARLPDDPKFSEIEKLGGRVDLHAEGHTIANGQFYVSGEIPRVTSWEQGVPGHCTWVEKDKPGEAVGEIREDGKWIRDHHIMDERYGAIDVLGKGLIILSSCSHAGICNVLNDAVKRFKRPIHMVLGGFHLGGPEMANRIPPTVKFMSDSLRPSPTYILPMHCSGFEAKVALRDALGEACVPASTGMHVVVKGDEESEKLVFEPSITLE